MSRLLEWATYVPTEEFISHAKTDMRFQSVVESLRKMQLILNMEDRSYLTQKDIHKCGLYDDIKKFGIAAEITVYNYMKGHPEYDKSVLKDYASLSESLKPKDIRTHPDEILLHDMFVLIPWLDSNHPILTNWRRNPNHTVIDSITNVGDSITGSVNLERPFISGGFQEIEARIHMTASWFRNGKFTLEEIAAGFLHEVGHVFEHFAMLGRMVLANHILEELNDTWVQKRDTQYRVNVLNQVNRYISLEDKEIKTLANTDNKTTVRNVIATRAVHHATSVHGTRYYDGSANESMADQFVTRLGGGFHLTTLLSKVENDNLDEYGKQRPPSEKNLRTLALTVGIIASLPFIPIVVLLSPVALGGIVLAALGYNASKREDLYDNSFKRQQRILHDMIDKLKKVSLPPDQHRVLIKQIRVVQEKLKSSPPDDEQFGLIQSLSFILRRDNRNQKKKAEYLDKLETLANNGLFVSASELSDLGGRDV